MSESILQFYKRIQRCDLNWVQPTLRRNHISMFSPDNVILGQYNSVIEIFTKSL